MHETRSVGRGSFAALRRLRMTASLSSRATYITSTIMAAASPPPMQIPARPRFSPRAFSA